MLDALIDEATLSMYASTIWKVLKMGGPYIAVIFGFNLVFFVAGLVQESMRNRASGGSTNSAGHTK